MHPTPGRAPAGLLTPGASAAPIGQRSGRDAPAGRAGREAFLAEVARAYYEQDLTQAQVAELHAISRSQVSRYLAMARDEGIVQIRIIAPGERDLELEAALCAAFPDLEQASVARVFDPRAPLVRYAVARVAAAVVDRLVRSGEIVCLGAGRTLAVMAALLPRRPIRGVIVVPATGNAGHAAHESDYSAVTLAVAGAWGALAYGINAPAILGSGASASALEHSSPQIAEALTTARGADLYVLGLGSLAGDEIFVRNGLVSSAELSTVRAAGAVGDLCGNFFDARGQAVVGPFTDRVVGIGLEDVRRPTGASHPGSASERTGRSIVCAGGAEKVPAIVAALRGGLAPHLVTDEHTARGVLDVVGGRRPAAV